MSLLDKIFIIFPAKLKNKAVFLFIIIVVAGFLEMVGIGFVIPITSLISNNIENSYFDFLGMNFSPNVEREKLIIIVIFIFFTFYILKAFILSFSIWLHSSFIHSFNFELCKKLIKKYLSHNYLYWSSENTSEKIKNISQEISNINIYIIDSCLRMLTELLVITSIIILLLYYNFFGTLSCVFFIIIALFVWKKIVSDKLNRISFERTQYDSLLFKQAQEAFLGIKDIKMYGRETNCLENFENNLINIKSIKTKFEFIGHLPKIYLEMIAITCLVFLILVTTHFLFDTENLLTNLSLFAAAAFKLIPSSNRLILSYQNIKYGIAPLNIITSDLINSHFLEKNISSNSDQIKFRKKINVCNISFIYPNTKKIILDNVNFEFKKGEVIGIIGQSGSGKTTFVDILSGLIEPTSGKILSDNLDIQKNIAKWKDQIGYIQQNTYLINDSIKNNIVFGINDLSSNNEQLKKTTLIAQLNDLIHELPMGIDTIVGEQGINLSGGQRQRIGIARAIYKNPEILILDESTNSLDSETEKKILENLKSLQGEKTILIISHNRESLRYCDKIIKIKNGNLKEILLKK